MSFLQNQHVASLFGSTLKIYFKSYQLDLAWCQLLSEKITAGARSHFRAALTTNTNLTHQTQNIRLYP